MKCTGWSDIARQIPIVPAGMKAPGGILQDMTHVLVKIQGILIIRILLAPELLIHIMMAIVMIFLNCHQANAYTKIHVGIRKQNK